MRITCPYCGTRDVGEFSYGGDAASQRPQFAANGSGGAEDAFFEHVYLRDNAAGVMDEYWYHGGGCRSWLVVTRDTVSHTIHAVRAAGGVASTATEVRR